MALHKMLTTALAFSGGKDSWACLWLNKDKLQEILVVWVDAGKNYPEMIETIAKAKELCPHFVTVTVDRQGQNAHHGVPSDIVPINWTRQGQEVTSVKPILIQPYLHCCYENLGKSLMDYCKRAGITHLIRGQRSDEGHKSSARHGDVVDGVTILQPIEGWTSEDVLDYVAQHMQLPEHFQFNHSSMDCYDCTAYTHESKDRIEYTMKRHPALYAEYALRKDALHAALKQAITMEELA